MLALFLFLVQAGCVAVHGDLIHAGDLAAAWPVFETFDANLVLGYAPSPGIERWLTRQELGRALEGKAPLSALPARLCVVRASRKITSGEIAAAMRRALPAGAKLEVIRTPDAPLPEGVPEFPLSGLRQAGEPGLYWWRGRLRLADSGRSVPFAAAVRILVEREVAVARRHLSAGETIAEGDIATVVREEGFWPDRKAQPAASFLGWRVRRDLAPGQVVEARQLVPPVAAKAGDRIALVVERGGARLSLEATAVTAGRVGDHVLLKTPLHQRRLRARILAPGLAILEEGQP
jgi:flagella basal body P-ring formation protein FlgA